MTDEPRYLFMRSLGVKLAVARALEDAGPDFQPIFAAYASDLKREAERTVRERGDTAMGGSNA